MPSIFVESLNAYNCGQSVGQWVACTEGEGFIWEAINEVLSLDGDAEEWFVPDYDGFGRYCVDEHPDLTELVKIAEGIELHGEVFSTFAELADQNGWSIDYFHDHYRGTYEDGADYAEQFYADLGLMSDDNPLYHYIDWDRVWEDELRFDLEYSDEGFNQFHVFDY
jgi:antirestriction protein